MTVCYVPEEGEAEPIPTECNENSLSFTASHFSTYAVLEANTTQVNTLHALRTAFNNAGDGDVIQLTGDITINSGTNLPLTLNTNKAVTLDLNGHNISITGNISLFKVQNGSLTIKDSAGDSSGQASAEQFSYKVMHSTVTNSAKGTTQESTQTYTVKTNGYIKGGSSVITTVSGGTFNLESGLLCEGTGRVVEQTGGTVNLSGGYINGFTKTSSNINSTDDFGGAVRVSGGALNLSGTVLSNNKAPNGGAIYNAGATVNMTGGVISGNTSTRTTSNWNNHSEGSALRCGGGGIYADGASTTNVGGGYITYNTATDTGYFDGGGGIFFSGTSTVNFTGGYITGNTANGGGGIRADFRNDTLKQTTTFNMSGGFLARNTANTAEGGGANLDRNCFATITAGYVTNNTCTKDTHWGGGGLFCADGATLSLESALITQNHAGGFGAGIGGCPTGHLYLYVNQGCAIYENTAEGKNYVQGGVKQIDKDRVEAYPEFLKHGYADFFCALQSSVIGTMLGDNAANWEGTADGKVVNLEKDAVVSAKQLMGLTAHPSDVAKTKAEGLATLHINGNSAATHGGGIMCNGNLIVGVPEDITNPSYLAVKGTKQLLKDDEKKSLEGKTFTFHITDESGKVITSGTNDASGNITFDESLMFNEPGTYTYYIAEVQTEESDPSLDYDTTRYRLTVTVTKDGGVPLYGDTVVYTCSISDTKLEISTDGGTTWQTTTATVKDGVLTLPEPNGATFTNREKYVLPETGGSGTFLLTVGGLLLLTGSLLFGYVSRRKRGRRLMG